MSLYEALLAWLSHADDFGRVAALYAIEEHCPDDDAFLEVLRSEPLRLWLK